MINSLLQRYFKRKGCIPVRAYICLMMFTACWTSYTCRLQLAILIVPMMNETKTNFTGGKCGAIANTSSTTQQPILNNAADLINKTDLSNKTDLNNETQKRLGRSLLSMEEDIIYEMSKARFHHRSKRSVDDFTNPSKKYNWNSKIRGQLISGYGYGNIPGNLLGGIMSLKFGPRKVVLWTSVLSAVMSLLSPMFASFHWGVLLVSRIIIGLAGGVVFPCCHAMVGKWAPPNEKGRFVWSLLGGTFGTVLTYPFVAYIGEHISWQMGWYIPSVLMFVWILFWILLAYDSPSEHPGITEEEKNYILTSQGGTVKTGKEKLGATPVKEILTSIPFISLVILHFGNLFLLFFYQSQMMIFLTKALGLKLTKGGFVASLPWLGRMGFGFVFTWIGDLVKKKQLMDMTVFRKLATIFSHCVPGLFLLAVGRSGCSITIVNIYLFFALGFNGAASISNLANNQDLSPNYAGFLYGIENTIGTASSIIIPPMVELIAGEYGHPIERWQTIFWIGSGVCIVSMVIFILGGSAKIQPWNDKQ